MDSNHSGRLSYVSFQSACNGSKISFHAGLRLKIAAGHMGFSWIAGKRFGDQFSTFDSPREYSQRIQPDDAQRNREAVPEAGRTKPFHTSEDRLNHGIIPMPTFATKPWTASSAMPAELPQSYMVGQQISELQFDKFPNLQSFKVWKIRCKNQATTCSDFPSDAMQWMKEVEMVDSLEKLKSSRSVCGKNVPNFEMLDTKIAGPVSTRKTDRLHDLRLLSSDWCT